MGALINNKIRLSSGQSTFFISAGVEIRVSARRDSCLVFSSDKKNYNLELSASDPPIYVDGVSIQGVADSLVATDFTDSIVDINYFE